MAIPPLYNEMGALHPLGGNGGGGRETGRDLESLVCLGVEARVAPFNSQIKTGSEFEVFIIILQLIS